MRSWWRHEQFSIAAAVATALHHSAQRGGVARRPTGTEDNRGTRPGVLKDPEPQLLDAVLAYRAAGVPSVAAPLLAAPADGVDEAALSFLQRRSLEDKRKEEQLEKKEEERKQKVLDSLEQKLQQMLHESSSSAVRRRKRKKRRKRRTPRTSSRSSCGRARRPQRQWHTSYAGFPGDVPLRAVFPSVVVRPELLDIMAVMYQKDSTTLVVNHGSGMRRIGFTGFDAPRVMFPSGVAKPRILRILAGMDQKNRCSCMYKAGIVGDNAPRAVFFSLVRRPMMLGIMAVMDQKDSCDMVPMFRLLKLWSLRSCSPSRSSTSLSRRRGSLSWSRPFVGPQTFPSCCTRFSTSLLCRWSRFTSPSWRRGRFHGPNCSFSHGHSTVAEHGGRCPCCAVLVFSSADVEETAELPQLQLVEFWTVVACPLCATTGVLSMTWRSSSTLVDVAVLPQRQVPAVGLDSWDEG